MTQTYAATRMMDIFNKLVEKEVEVYTPQQKIGECTSPYVVVKDMGTAKHAEFSSTVTDYTVMCYVPRDKFTTLATFVETVKAHMKELEPMIRPTYEETPSFYDDTVKGHMISIDYINYRKI